MTLSARPVGMCPATLLTDPMQCDADTLARLLEATAGAGFGSVSLWAMHRAGRDPGRTARMLADAGLPAPVVEALTRWSDGPGAELVAEARPVVEFAAALGAHTVVACRLDAGLDAARAADGFAALCALAAEHGLRVCIEFLPWSGIADLATAWRLVTAAGAPNGGILIDTWHWVRQPGGPDLDLLGRIPGERIHYVQLGRAADERREDLFAEAMTARLPLAPTGSPAADAVGALFAGLEEIGADPYVAVEIFNSELAASGPAAMATLLAGTTAAGLPAH